MFITKSGLGGKVPRPVPAAQERPLTPGAREDGPSAAAPQPAVSELPVPGMPAAQGGAPPGVPDQAIHRAFGSDELQLASHGEMAGLDSLDDPVRVPGTMTPGAKRVVAYALLAAAALVLAGGLVRWNAQQRRLSDDARARPVSGPERAATAAAMPPSPSAAPTAPTAVTTQVAPPPGSAALAVSAPPSSAAMASAASPRVAVPPTFAVTGRFPPQSQEKPLDTTPEPAGETLVMQASHALSRGATAHAVELARQAVSANPGNADAWLTLGAAFQASGNASAARDAYQSCVAQARTANVSECRMLAGH
jgi:hypothetical protein